MNVESERKVYRIDIEMRFRTSSLSIARQEIITTRRACIAYKFEIISVIKCNLQMFLLSHKYFDRYWMAQSNQKCFVSYFSARGRYAILLKPIAESMTESAK